MQYVIGIDGGGTKTILKIADMEGKLVTVCEGGPSNINSNGKQNVEDILKKLIFDGVEKVGGKFENCRSLCLGTAGAGREKDRNILEGIIRNIGYNGELIVTDDAQTALYGGVGSSEGIIIISGTGSICYGRNSSGKTCRAGGWGHIIGDEGSGYYIGQKVLSHVMRSYDGREEHTLLTSMILKHLKLEKVEDLIEYVYRSGAGKKEISGIARLADNAWLLGDETAHKILIDAADELFICARAVIERLEFGNKLVTLAISGSILVKSECVQNEFKRLVNDSYPLVNIAHMKDDAAWGAVTIALEKIGSGI